MPGTNLFARIFKKVSYLQAYFLRIFWHLLTRNPLWHLFCFVSDSDLDRVLSNRFVSGIQNYEVRKRPVLTVCTPIK